MARGVLKEEVLRHCVSMARYFLSPLFKSLETSTASDIPGLLPAFVRATLRRVGSVVVRFVPVACRAVPEQARRARLIVHFGFQGAVFGFIYDTFYLLIGHRLGAAIIAACSLIFAAVPWILRRTAAMRFTGHVLVGTMTAGFSELALIEGGVHGHAVAWLASVPLCALLILGVRPAAAWALLCFGAGSAIAIAAVCGVELAPAYDLRWQTLIDAAGNLGIIAFLFILGLVFETNRATAFQRMEESLGALAASNGELAHLNAEKTEFLGIAAHDLRNPLTAVIGMGDLLSDHADASVAERADLICRSGRRMLELIKDLLDANAIEEGRYAAEVEPCDLRELAVAGLEHNQAAAVRKGISLEMISGPACLGLADRKATLQILDNLVSNALKYSPPGSQVTVAARVVGDSAEISVSDQGPGISVDDQAKLFQKHTRLSARPTGGESSVGLGLSIVKKLSEAMGGGIRHTNRPGGGSVFILRLRAVPAPGAASPGTVDAISATASR